ncbi:MAG: DNA-protecting protein DprA [Sphingobacteriales bacterium]|nr:MAG: DNA-protecting protein DprA [Sphingobacteriales bacterium]
MSYQDPDLIYQLALTDVPYIGYVQAKLLVEQFGSAEAVFRAPPGLLEKISNMGAARAASIKRFRDFRAAEEEIKFITKYKIEPLFLTNSRYPKQLLNCDDAPTMLYYRGNADPSASRMISIVGTRSGTDYGKRITDKMVQALAGYGVTIVSGLAFGIDAWAHKAAIKYDIPTIGVLAHGLDTIYPPEHTPLARNMLKNGGLLSEFRSNTKPDRYNFPSRNRIVAGMCEALIVIETGTKGGSLITADLALGYCRDVFAFPGKITDTRSQGCNKLIAINAAALLTEPEQFIEAMGWNDKQKKQPQPKELFDNLTENEQKIVDMLKETAPMHIDELKVRSGLSAGTTASVILALELRSIITTLPGKRLNLL